MDTRTTEQTDRRIHLAGLIMSGNSLELPETITEAAGVLGIPVEQYRLSHDWPRVVATLALQMADAVLEQAEEPAPLAELEHPRMDDASAAELRRIAQQANALWRRHGRVKSSELGEIAKYLAHWSRAVHVDLYGHDGPPNER